MPRRAPSDPVVLLTTERAEIVRELEDALSRRGIPYDVGLLPGPPARMVFSVPRSRLEQARRALALLDDDADDARGDEPGADEPPAVFPRGPVLAVLAVIAVHVGVVLALASPLLDRRLVLAAGAVGPAVTQSEPWRLVTSLVLHSGLRHVGWNAVSMMVFAVPLLVELGPLRAWTIYLLAGIGGGVATTWLGTPGTLAIGSSGAVAGLFGAWVAHRLRHARRALPNWRLRVRALGIGLLVLPSLLTPTGPYGQRISVTSHLGGLVAGLVLGWILSREVPALSFRRRPPSPRTG